MMTRLTAITRLTSGSARLVLGLVALSFLVTSACDQPGDRRRSNPGAVLNWIETERLELALATSCEDARESFRDAAKANMRLRIESERYWYQQWQDGDFWQDGVPISEGISAPAESGAASADASVGGSGSRNYSDTNIQVRGVDEADIVKTDGTMIYSLKGEDLVLISAWPAENIQETARLSLPGQPYALYLVRDRVIALSRAHSAVDDPREFHPGLDIDMMFELPAYSWREVTVVSVIDVRNPASPTIVEQQAFDGASVDTRRVGDRVTLVQSTWLDNLENALNYWPNVHYDADSVDIELAFDALIRQNDAIIDSFDIDAWLPSRYDFVDGQVQSETSELLTECTQVYTPSVYAGSGLLTVVSFDLEQPSQAIGTSITGDWGTVYATLDALYIATNNTQLASQLSLDEVGFKDSTQIHKFSFSEEPGEAAIWQASGVVDGHTLNQFSFDERDGQLRVATTVGEVWSETASESFVSILEARDQALITIGKVGELGFGERIYSVRFVGETGYVVTFRETDPLYVIDLRDPTAPKVTGELKIPGFSTYMHPIGGQQLLAIGRDGTMSGETLGLQLQIFDVSDPSAPRVAHKTSIGTDWGTWSSAQDDHHAFVYYAQAKMLAIPVESWSYDEFTGHESLHSRLEIFNIDTQEGFSAQGSIDHRSLLSSPIAQNNDDCAPYPWEVNPSIQRGIFIEDHIYSISQMGIQAHQLDRIAEGPAAALRFDSESDTKEDVGCTEVELY